MLCESWTLLRWYRLPGTLGKGRVSLRPLWWMVMKPSSMSMSGVPYSPMVPSFTRWASGASSAMAKRTFRVPMTLFVWVNVACSRSIIE